MSVRRRKVRARSGAHSGRAAFAFVMALAFAPSAQAMQWVLQVDAGASALSATAYAVGADTKPLQISGTLTARVTLSQHPNFGRVVDSIHVQGANLGLADLTLLPGFGSQVSLSLSTGSVGFGASAPAAPGTATATHTSLHDVSGAELLFDAGSLAAGGSALGVPVSESRDLAVSSLTGVLPQGAELTAVLDPAAPNGTELTLSLPIDQVVLALDDPLDVPVEVSGTLVFRGLEPPPIPGMSPAGGVLLAAVLATLTSWWMRRRAG